MAEDLCKDTALAPSQVTFLLEFWLKILLLCVFTAELK